MQQATEAAQGSRPGLARCSTASRLSKKGVLVQAGGHGDSFHLPEDRPDCVLKPCCAVEQLALQELMDTPELRPYVPRYHGIQQRSSKEAVTEGAEGSANEGIAAEEASAGAEGTTATGGVAAEGARTAAEGVNDDFLIIQNLLHGMVDPVVMDIKMGTRTFELAEAQSEARRADLLQKMLATDPAEPTAEEREAGGITKLRWGGWFAVLGAQVGRKEGH